MAMNETNPRSITTNSNLPSPPDIPFSTSDNSDSTNYQSSKTISNLINQLQISVNEKLSSPNNTPTYDQQQLIPPSTSDVGETKTRHNPEDSLPPPPSSSSSTMSDVQQEQQLENPSVGETMTQDSDSPSSSSNASRRQRKHQELRKKIKIPYTYIREHNAYLIPAIPSREGSPPSEPYMMPKDEMQEICDMAIAKMKPILLRKIKTQRFLRRKKHRSLLALKISNDSHKTKKPTFNPFTYLRQRTRPPKASADDTKFKIPAEPSSRRAPDNNEAGPSGGDGDESGDIVPQKVLDSSVAKQQFDTADGGSMVTPNANDNECSTRDMDEVNLENQFDLSM